MGRTYSRVLRLKCNLPYMLISEISISGPQEQHVTARQTDRVLSCDNTITITQGIHLVF